MSPITMRDVLLEIVTTTVYSDVPAPTGSTRQGSRNDEVPVGTIVGATAGGALLAVLAVVAWKVWRRSLKRKRTRARWNEEALRVTKENTKQNSASGTTKTRSRSHSPVFWAPPPSKVKFAAATKGDETSSTPSLATNDKSSHAAGDKEKGTMANPPVITPSKPRPLKSSKRLADANKTTNKDSQSGSSDTNVSLAPSLLPQPPPPPPPPRAARRPRHKASTVSSGSYYSLESGEEHNGSRTGRFHSVISALENMSDVTGPRSSAGGNRLSVSSSLWSFLSKNSRGGRGPPSRISQATTNSAYSQPDEPEVGVAC
ncbi:hypothetical protein VNI00_005117 [Paramarasmius palmivorus]|uniref:Uncharacterized protein n=1 Tax=Paramarasmius palmivorus TaxID=297713 RepID=A0AAW0DJA5_9AGAR